MSWASGDPPARGQPVGTDGEHEFREPHQVPRGQTLADKVERLFRTIYPRGRGPYSLEEVAEAIRRQGGPTISATYIWQLRRGLKDNPTKKHLEALAEFF